MKANDKNSTRKLSKLNFVTNWLFGWMEYVGAEVSGFSLGSRPNESPAIINAAIENKEYIETIRQPRS